MIEEMESTIAADSMSLNLITESASRVLLLVAGLVSGAILVRAVDITEYWTLSDYAHLKVLMYWNQLISVVIIFGLTTAVVRSVSSHSHEPKNIGRALAISLLTVTSVYLVFTLLTTLLAEQVGFLIADSPETTTELRTLWVLVLLSMLPNAYIIIAKSFFSGIQRMKRNLIVDVVYNGSRIAILVYLFVSATITLINILYMYLLILFLGFAIALIQITRELRLENIPFTLSGSQEVVGPLFRVAGAFLALTLIASFGNYVIPLLVNFFGTDTDMARFSIADSTSATLRALLYVPFAVLLPNITGMFSRGEHEDLLKRFNESNRIIIPTLIFAFLATFSFSDYLLGGIYGVKALDTTGGLSAAQFLKILAPGLLFSTIIGLYSNPLIALNKMKVLLVLGILNVTLQVAWIVIMQPLFGVITLAFLWVLSIPLFLAYHYANRKLTHLTIGRNLLFRSAILLLVAAPVTLGFAFAANLISNLIVAGLSFIPLISTTTFSSLLKLLFLAPLWYIFLSLCLLTGVMKLSDLDNLKKFLRKIPPVWWISNPLIGYIERVEKRRIAATAVV